MQNILETQVSDLSSLVDSPILPLPGGRGNGSLAAAAQLRRPAAMMLGREQDRVEMERLVRGESREGERVSGGSGKRKNEEGGVGDGIGNGSAAQGGGAGHNGHSMGGQRAKRNRYISIACNECKRRKIKCNGQSPCQRCGNLNLSCQYAPNCCASTFKDSDEFKAITQHLTNLQQQVENLYASMEDLRRQNSALNGSEQREHVGNAASEADYRTQVRTTPRFQGPTSTGYSFDVAKETLQNMGYSGIETSPFEGADGEGENETPMQSPEDRNPAVPSWRDVVDARDDRDVLQLLGHEEARRLCQIYADEVGSMYPLLDMETVNETCSRVYGTSQSPSQPQNGARLSHGLPAPSQPPNVSTNDINILKMVIAIATVAEGSGPSSLGERIFRQVRPSFDTIIHSQSLHLSSIPLIFLVATYHFHCDLEALAWRTLGHAARMCIELGLHRRSSLFRNFPDPASRSRALRIFWSIYCVDRRWSFGTGMPFAIQDADIDPSLPGPDDSLEYLQCMIAYSRLGGRVWRSVAGWEDGAELRREDVGYLDYQVLEWQKSLPANLQLPSATTQPQHAPRGILRLQVILFLRTNQMRILIYRPVLHSAAAIRENPQWADTVVDLAQATIRALTQLNQTTDIYRAQQVCFNYFLLSALAVLFLAACQRPEVYSSRVRGEFYSALDLVKGFEGRSYVAKRLWRTIKGLKEVGPKLGLVNEPGGSADRDGPSSAAMAMAGLAAHDLGAASGGGGAGAGFAVSNQAAVANGESPEVNGFHMCTEMTQLFEAALGAVTGLQGGYPSAGEADIQSSLLAMNTGIGGVGTGGPEVGMSSGGAGGSGLFGGEEELYRQMRDLF